MSLAPNPAQRPRQLRKPKAEYLCMAYPEHPATTNPAYWLAAYLRDLAHHAALQALEKRSFGRKGPGTDPITQLAITSAVLTQHDELKKMAKLTKESGLLLYAWPGTSFFNQPDAAH